MIHFHGSEILVQNILDIEVLYKHDHINEGQQSTAQIGEWATRRDALANKQDNRAREHVQSRDHVSG